MALRARLTPPRETKTDWPWHKVKSSSLRASLLFGGERRMEAENFLANGFGKRLSIESKTSSWCKLSDRARVWQPSRLKGIQVRSDFGTPFLAATQVFDVRPVPRKWLSLDRTSDYEGRFLNEGTILLTCSGSVGRATIAHTSTNSALVSHDLLRIDAINPDWRGWIYAYLRAPSVRNLMESAQYGHIIKHLETHHLEAVPLIEPSDAAILDECKRKFQLIIECRDAARAKMAEAESGFAKSFGAKEERHQEAAFIRRASDFLFSGRRRFDAWNHNPRKVAIEERLQSDAVALNSLRELGCDVWLPNRFKRVPAEDGVELIDSSQIFEINPDIKRKISASGISDRYKGFVKAGWLMMSRSGQVYGLLGSVAIATGRHEGKILSDDVIRIAPGEAIRSGYLYVALSHPTLGRPRTKSLAYGSSIPHIEVEDLKDFQIPRLLNETECYIADLAEEAFALWSEADDAENLLAEIAEIEIERFLRS